jgi:pyridoxamine 5'-phosphate oxidase
LEQKLAEVAARFGSDAVIPRPPRWGGYRVVPSVIEFWRDQPDRLHDRIVFTRDASRWLQARLQP